MEEPEKPFACTIPNCGMTFTNEDHLTVHTKKHDMYLQLGLEQKAAFVADQTPTPTRFIRNCEEVGLFQDLQNVNPFEEGFKRAMETSKNGLLSLENSMPPTTTDDLHTPQMVFPILDNADSTLYTSNNQKNITISRSSSDESRTIKEYETTTISKLTNEVTTISRVVNKHDVLDKSHAVDNAPAKANEHITHTDVHNETSVSYTNNVIKIHNNIEIRKDNHVNVDSGAKDEGVITKDALLANKSEIGTKLPPMMSQKSIDLVMDTISSDVCHQNMIRTPEVKARNIKTNAIPKINPPRSATNSNNNKINCKPKTAETKSVDDYEVIIKLPNGKQVRMKAVDDGASDRPATENGIKEKLKEAINNKVSQNNAKFHRLPSGLVTNLPGMLPLTTGTLIPVTLVNANGQLVQKIPIPPLKQMSTPSRLRKTVKRQHARNFANDTVSSSNDNDYGETIIGDAKVDDADDCVIVGDAVAPKKRSKEELDSRVQASRRYRIRLKELMKKQEDEIKELRDANQRLVNEKAVLKLIITEHMKKCPNADDMRTTQEKLLRCGANV